MVAVTGEFKWERDRNSIKPFWKSVESLSLQNITEGWDGVEQGGADHKMFFLALVVLVLMPIKCSCWPGYSWLKPRADCLTDVLFLWYQMQAFNFWLMCTSLRVYFYQVFSTPDVAAGDFPRGHLLLLRHAGLAAPSGQQLPGAAARAQPRGLIPSWATGFIHSEPGTPQRLESGFFLRPANGFQ